MGINNKLTSVAGPDLKPTHLADSLPLTTARLGNCRPEPVPPSSARARQNVVLIKIDERIRGRRVLQFSRASET